MKFLVVLAVAVACASADVKDESKAQVLRAEYDIKPEGSFGYNYETDNGIAAQVAGAVVNGGGEYPTLEFKGAYKYTAPDGFPVEVSYVANADGFQPSGNVLPTAPPTPEAILRSLEYIAAHPPQAEFSAKAAPSYKPTLG